jgi:hypothetical protein
MIVHESVYFYGIYHMHIDEKPFISKLFLIYEQSGRFVGKAKDYFM